VDPYGNVLSEDDFFADDDHVMITDIPLHRTKTMYASVGDVLIYLSYIYLGVVGLYLLVLSIIKRIGSSPAKSDANKILPT
jgi:apolipoprotein N-acyltransferase